MEICSLWPLSAAEIAYDATINRADVLFNGDLRSLKLPPYERQELIQSLLRGGFPEAVSRVSDRRKTAWFDSYLQAILQRDVRDLAQVEQLTELPHLLKLLASVVPAYLILPKFHVLVIWLRLRLNGISLY